MADADGNISPESSEDKFEKKELRRIGIEHVCFLPQRESIVVHYIRYGYFVKLRRKFRRMLLVSDSNPLCRIYLRSGAAVRMEQTRHLHQYYYIIHPFSIFQRYFEMFRLVILSLLFVVIPLDICCHDYYLTYFKFCLDCCTIFGIICTFWTGFLSSTHNIILDKKSIARRYLLHYFIIDCVTSGTIFIVLLQILVPSLMSLKHVFYIKLLNYLKLLKLGYWMKFWESFRQLQQINIYLFKILKLILYYSFVVWWSGCVLYMVELYSDETSSLYVRDHSLGTDILCSCIYHAVYMIFQIGSGEQHTDRLAILIVQIAVLLIGNFLHIYSVSQLMHIVQKYHSSKNKYAEIHQQVQEFLKQKEVPEYTRRRVMLYFDFRYQLHYYKENDVLSTLSKNLRQEIFLYRCKNLILKSKMFKMVPASLLNRIVAFMRTKIFLCNDLLVQAGTDGSEMFFIYSGTVAVYTPHGREVCHLTEGGNFGEVSLIFENMTRAATVIAIDTVEIYTLGRQDFLRAIEPFPDVYLNIRKSAEEHFKNLMTTDTDSDESDDHNSNDSSDETLRSDDSYKSPTDITDADRNSSTKIKSRLHYHV